MLSTEVEKGLEWLLMAIPICPKLPPPPYSLFSSNIWVFAPSTRDSGRLFIWDLIGVIFPSVPVFISCLFAHSWQFIRYTKIKLMQSYTCNKSCNKSIMNVIMFLRGISFEICMLRTYGIPLSLYWLVFLTLCPSHL